MTDIRNAWLILVCGCAFIVSDARAGHPEEGQKLADADLISTGHWVLHTELTLDRPLSEVWPVFKDMKRWYTEYTWESFSGPSYQEGPGLAENQVLKLTHVRTSDYAAGLHQSLLKVLKVVPHREIVAVLSGPADEWKRYTWFYVWKVTERGRKTTIFVDSYGEAEFLKPLSKAEFTEYHDKLARKAERSWAEALVNLGRVLDADH